MSLADLAASDALVRATLMDPKVSHYAAVRALAAQEVVISEKSVRRWRAKNRPALHTDALPFTQPGTAEVVGEDTIVFQGVVIDRNLQGESDWSKIFAIFGLDPEHFEIEKDTVKIGTWQQSKGLEDGSRSNVQLWSHSARFRKISGTRISKTTLSKWRSGLIGSYHRAATPRWVSPAAAQGTYNHCIADPQLGKKGTEEAVENWKTAVEGHSDEIAKLIVQGNSPEKIHVAFMGDEAEGVCNNYTNQPHTIELNLTGQLELDYDLRVWTLRKYSEFGLPMSASSVISNHGEWTRNGGKDVVTTRGDNASTFIARQVKKMFAELEPFGGPKIDWTIGGGDPGLLVNLSGVKAYFSHGYIEKGKGTSTETRTRSAIERQILGRTDELADVPLWFMAHYHHFYSQEFEGRTLFGCPALEAEKSSEYMRDQYGVWSPSGSLGLLVGSHLKRGWSNLSIH